MGADDGDDDNDALEKQEEVDTDRDRVSRDNNGNINWYTSDILVMMM